MARRNRSNRRSRRGRFSFLYKLLCLALIAGAIVAALAVFFKADHLEITGNSRYSVQQIREASGVSEGDNLYLMNKYAVARRIQAALPYVETVNIHRRLPDTLCISVTECRHLVSLEQEGKIWIISDGGRIVDCVTQAPSGAVAVTGIALTGPQIGDLATTDETYDAPWQNLLAILQQLRNKGMMQDVQAVHLENADLITLRYLDRFDVQIPWNADFDYKLDFLAAVVAKLEENEQGTLILTKDGEARFVVKAAEQTGGN